jgi:hypothetical protein
MIASVLSFRSRPARSPNGSTVHLWCRHAADLIPGFALSSIIHAEGT